jgi:hypothetical protein
MTLFSAGKLEKDDAETKNDKRGEASTGGAV